MENNYIAEQISKTQMSCQDYSRPGQKPFKAVVLTRLINSHLFSVTVQDADIEEYPRTNEICPYFDITDEFFIKVSDRPEYIEEAV